MAEREARARERIGEAAALSVGEPVRVLAIAQARRGGFVGHLPLAISIALVIQSFEPLNDDAWLPAWVGVVGLAGLALSILWMMRTPVRALVRTDSYLSLFALDRDWIRATEREGFVLTTALARTDAAGLTGELGGGGSITVGDQRVWPLSGRRADKAAFAQAVAPSASTSTPAGVVARSAAGDGLAPARGREGTDELRTSPRAKVVGVLIALALVAGVVASFVKSDRERAAEALAGFLEAFASGDGIEACSLLTPESRELFIEASAIGVCQTGVQEELERARRRGEDIPADPDLDPGLIADDLELDGTRAEIDESNPLSESFSLELVGDRWLVEVDPELAVRAPQTPAF